MKKTRGKQVAGLVAGLTVEHATAFQDIFVRLKRASGSNSDAELADKLGLKRSSISTAKTRKMVPSSWIVNVANLFDVSADWLIFGDKKFPEKGLEETQPEPKATVQAEPEKNNNIHDIIKEWLLDLPLSEFEALWDEYRREREGRRGWLQVEVINRFPEFLEWLKNRPEPVTIPPAATLKKDEPTFHMGLPIAPPKD